MKQLLVIGGGLAGTEASWQAAERGVEVELCEMRPESMTPAHQTGYLAELVCSNSLGSNERTTAGGLLKEEMRYLNSIILRSADDSKVPAGGALAVDRERFAAKVTETIQAHPNIALKREEISDIPEDRPVIIASGPLTSEALASSLAKLIDEDYLYFYDASAPIISADSIDYERSFFASRYDKGGKEDYLNCPLNKGEYEMFQGELVEAEKAPRHDFDDIPYFEGCLPIEELARRGRDTLRFGPLKPVGLIDPRTQNRPYAVVQLRTENKERTLYNLVGFQTRLKWSEQRRVFRLIPALHSAEFVRYGVMHRNTFINSTHLLKPTLQLIRNELIFFAGQITGVEGYIESAGMGLIAGINAAKLIKGDEPIVFPPTTAFGALTCYITSATENFQPMNANWGLFPPLEEKIRDKRERRYKLAQRSLKELKLLASKLI